MKFTKLTILLIIFLFTAKSANAAITLRPALNLGLVGYWSMNEGIGTQAGDSSGNGNTGTLSGGTAPTWVDGKRGKALNFNGTSSYVRAEDSPSLDFGSGNFSVSAWIKPSDLSILQYILSKYAANSTGTGFSIRILNTGVANVIIDDNVTAINVSFNTFTVDNNWHHIAVAVDKSQATGINVYFDGSSQNCTGNCSYDLTTIGGVDNNLKLGIGTRDGSDPGGYFNGQIDEVRMYNRVLSSTEVAALYSSGAAKFLAPNNTGLVGSWSFEEGTGTQAGDSSGNGNTGTLSGGTAPTWVDGKRGKALSFNGINNAVTTPVNIGGIDEKTFTGWFNFHDISTTWQFMFAEATSFDSNKYSGLLMDNTGPKIRIYQSYNGGASTFETASTFTPVSNQWYHVAGVISKSSNFLKLYINGHLDNTYSNVAIGSSTFYDPTGNVKISVTTESEGGNPFNGIMDELRVYNRALSDTEVEGLYQTSGKGAKINSSQNSRITNGLVGLWSFNGQDIYGATAYDRSGSNNNGTISGATPTIGKVGQALNFNGSSSYVGTGSLPQSTILTTNQTISLWFRPNIDFTNTIGRVDLLSRHDGPFIAYDFDDGKITYSYYNSDTQLARINYSSDFSAGNWYHVVGVHDASNGYLYINGGDVGTPANVDMTTPYAGSYPLTIGALYLRNGMYANAVIDEVRIYNRALDVSEVQQLYNMGK